MLTVDATDPLHQALSSPNAPINVLQSAVKREIFKPVFMNFPVLDRFPFPSRARARQMVNRFKQELRRALVQSRQRHRPLSPPAASPDGLGQRMLEAKKSGLWNEKQLLDNLTVVFVAGQENPQLCMISTLYLLAKHAVSTTPGRFDRPSVVVPGSMVGAALGKALADCMAGLTLVGRASQALRRDPAKRC